MHGTAEPKPSFVTTKSVRKIKSRFLTEEGPELVVQGRVAWWTCDGGCREPEQRARLAGLGLNRKRKGAQREEKSVLGWKEEDVGAPGLPTVGALESEGWQRT